MISAHASPPVRCCSAFSWPRPGPAAVRPSTVLYVRQIRRSWSCGRPEPCSARKTDAVRRADYYRDPGARGWQAAKEMRVLGLLSPAGSMRSATAARVDDCSLMQQWKSASMGRCARQRRCGERRRPGRARRLRRAGRTTRRSGVITIGALVIYLRAAQAISWLGPQQRRLPDRVRPARSVTGAARTSRR